ncbi:MAG: hypothetical protein H7Z75_07865 [Ferruginibacter sp.]|nr:hypothetical protein [Cytophagales bacterium]
MLPQIRRSYNESFSESAYAAFLEGMRREHGHPVLFRVAETPVFLPAALKGRLVEACEGILEVVMRKDFRQLSRGAIPAGLAVPNEDAHTTFLAIDFAVCRDEAGELVPQLIELQGFPSLYGYQELLNRSFRRHFAVPGGFTPFFSGLDREGYVELLRKAVLGECGSENVVLLEIEPEKQKTNVDFYCTQALLGVRPVCISEVVKEGTRLFYRDGDRKTPIHRIYNRVIFDELLKRRDLPRAFNLTDAVEVEWAGHPNWFFRISKFTMPLLTRLGAASRYVPESRFLSEMSAYPADLENYVLKPLYSFAGAGVKFDVTPADLDAVGEGARPDYILQKKVNYEPVVEAADGGLVKAEIRMLYLWPERDATPTLAVNLARLSRGVMIGVDFNKNKTWVGGTIALFEK